MQNEEAVDLAARTYVLETIISDLLVNVFTGPDGLADLERAKAATIDRLQFGPLVSADAAGVRSRAIIAARKLFARVAENLGRASHDVPR